MMTAGAARKLVEDLRAATNAEDLAEQLQHETDRARRFAASGI
jgi:transcriptional regulator of met regulon